ncbi:polysaccharide biosynthesis/export family protein [Sphingomonas sp. dw_22]|uniref:polysaccharide biosynthesis/export family protein n=1 Tax=Sphingomonas sp. dw_22 TaxID=2721175 RepID=UPI001BD293F9|nr:polysaccharide biosynthesis/export family protein [Sphingomonas sp. dw_22]
MKNQLRQILLLATATSFATPASAQIPTRRLPTPAPAQQQVPLASAPAQTVPQANGAAPSVPAPAVAPAGYRIGADDVIEVDVLGQSDFKTRARVSSDGTVTLPYLGAVPVTGETSISLADKLAAQLRAGGYYAKPIVSVEIVGFVSNYIVVLGEVGVAGLQPIDRGYRVSEILARAGGLKITAAEEVVLTHADGTAEHLDYQKLASGGPSDDPVVKAGDKLFVPQAEQFYIYGQVNAPGVYPIRADMTLRRALARGGGLTPSGSTGRVKVYRDGAERKMKLDETLQPGDVVVVGERVF